MDSKITLSGLAAMIALASGQPGQLCENFLKELFRIIGDELEKGESVRIKGLGTFKVTDVEARKSVDVTTGEEIEIAAHRKVVFVASKELAALVNGPFETFEAVEVSDALPTDELLDIAEETDNLVSIDSDKLIDVDSDSLADESEIAETDSAEAEKVIESKVSPKPTIEKLSKATSSDPSKELKKAEAVGPLIITSDILGIHDDEEPVEKKKNLQAATTTRTQAAQEVDDMEEEEPGKPVISFSPAVSSGHTRKRRRDDNDSGEDDGEKKSVNKEPIKTIHFETAEGDEEERVEPGRGRSRFGSGFLTGFLSAIALIALVILIGYKFDVVPNKVSNMLAKNSAEEPYVGDDEPEADVILPDSAYVDSLSEGGVPSESAADPVESVVPTQPSDQQPVYDVVSTTRYLTTMAKEHYGNFNLWPIIYEENQAFLGHPDRIKPGTQVVIPPLSKYNVNPDNPEDIKRVKRKGVAIYAKFK